MPWSAPFGFNNAIEIVAPLDHRTTDLNAAAEWGNERGSLRVQYDGSWFNNDVQMLIWDNPIKFTDSTYGAAYVAGDGTSQGRMALWPSSTLNVVSVLGTARLPARGRATAYVSIGSWRQDEALLPFTINTASVNVPTLPAASLHGEKNTLAMNYTLNSRILQHLPLTVRYRSYDYDNDTPSLTFSSYVSTDRSLSSVARRSLPYGYHRQNLIADVGWEFGKASSLKFGYEWERMNRKHRDVERSDEHSVGATLDITTEAGRNNEKSLRDLRDQTLNLVEAQRVNKESADTMIESAREGRREFIRVARQMGLTEEAAEDLADEYLGIPAKVESQILVHASGEWKAIVSNKGGDRGVLPGPGGFYAEGGHVQGPGTSTSDSIRAWLSDGEFVQKASAVDKYGVGFMSALNEGAIPKEALPGFANGGYVSTGKGDTPWARINSHRGNVRRDYNRMVQDLISALGDHMGNEFKNSMRGPAGVVRLAEASLGKYPESNGNNTNAITSWFGMNGAPWCAMFISWLFARAGASRALGGAARTAWTGDYYNSGMRRVSNPMPGDVAVYGTRHVNLIASPGGGRRIGGNQSNNVTAAPYSGGAIFRPDWSKVGFARGGMVSMRDLMSQNLIEDQTAGQNQLVKSIRQAVGLDERPTRRARGGPVSTGQWSWVGEEGPELVKFSSPGQVYSAQQSAAITAESSRLSTTDGEGASPLIGEYHQHLHNGEATFREGMRELTHTLKVTRKGGRYADA